MSDLQELYGRDQLMVVAAVRYSLGRSSSIVSVCADWLLKIWPALDRSTQLIVSRDIEDAFKRDAEDRALGRPHTALGMDIDRIHWQRVRVLWAK